MRQKNVLLVQRWCPPCLHTACPLHCSLTPSHFELPWKAFFIPKSLPKAQLERKPWCGSVCISMSQDPPCPRSAQLAAPHPPMRQTKCATCTIGCKLALRMRTRSTRGPQQPRRRSVPESTHGGGQERHSPPAAAHTVHFFVCCSPAVLSGMASAKGGSGAGTRKSHGSFC